MNMIDKNVKVISKNKLKYLFCVLGLLFMLIILKSYFSWIIKNERTYFPDNLYYETNDKISLESDFFFNSSEEAKGYFITVFSTELISKEDFISEYNIKNNERFNHIDYIYVVYADFENESNSDYENNGIDVSNYMIQSCDYINYANVDLFECINNFNSHKFFLKKETSRQFAIPFAINEDYINIDDLQSAETKFIISLYPNKKMISLN